jgi:tetratricopeptide (TPR) repeat protein
MNSKDNQSDDAVSQGRALVRAIEALEAVASTDPVAGALAAQLTTAYRDQLSAIAEAAPPSAAEAILKEQALMKSRRRCCVCHQFAGEDINVFNIDPNALDAPSSLDDAIVLCLRCNAEAVYARSQPITDGKYSTQELQRHRDLWWEWCEEHPDVTIPTSLPGVHGEHVYMPLPLPDTGILSEPGPLPPGSRLPYPRNRRFTGRIEALNSLARALLPHAHTRPTPVLITQTTHGMGGMGKTQLAIEFAYRYGRFFSGIHWLDGTRPSNLGAEIAACGEEMDLPHWPERRHPEKVSRTLEEWHKGGTRLVIVDDLDGKDEEAAREWLDRVSGGPLRILLTSRRSSWPDDLPLNPLPLDAFAPQESLRFLRQYLPESRTTDAELESLAEQLRHLPLAIDLAGHYLSSHSYVSASNYLRLMKTAWDGVTTAEWRQHLNGEEHNLDQAATFALSWERVTNENTRRLFLLAGHCAPGHPIPGELLQDAAGLKIEDCVKGLVDLSGLGLLHAEETGDSIIHPVLAEYARTLPDADELLPALAEALAHLANSATKLMKQTDTPSYFFPLLPHVCSVIERIEGQSLETMEAMGTLWNSLGSYQDQTGEYNEARASFERALAIWQRVYGDISAQSATAHSNLGGILQGLGDLEGALESFERALAIDEGTYGPDHPDVARDLNNLGGVLVAIGDPRGAWSAYVCALAILKYVLGEDHPEVATQLTKVGAALRSQNDLVGAREAFESALSIFEQVYPSGHPQVRAVKEILESLAAQESVTPSSQFAMYPVFVDEAGRYYLCPGCGTVREEDVDKDGEISEVKYHELDGDTLPEDVVEKARDTLGQIAAQKAGRVAIERIRAASRAVQQHPYYDVSRGASEDARPVARSSSTGKATT